MPKHTSDPLPEVFTQLPSVKSVEDIEQLLPWNVQSIEINRV